MGEVSYDKSADDLADTYRDHFGATLRRQGWRQAAILAAVGVAVMTVASHGDAGSGTAAWFGAGIGLLLALPVCWALSWSLLPRRARRLFGQQRTDDVRWTWRWSPDGLESETHTGINRYRWHELHGWRDVRRSLQFFLNDLHLLYIPRHRLSPDQADELRMLADEAGVKRR